jgi:ATP-dependent RNA helicase DeaD
MGHAVAALHGGMPQGRRNRVLQGLRMRHLRVLVATDVAARGLDIDPISHVFNYDLPEDPEIYVHRIGRTGRAGKSGVAISLVSPGERRRLAQVEQFARAKIDRARLPSEEDIRAYREEQLLKKVTVWLQRGRSHRERDLAQQLADQGFDLLEVAAAALKVARAEEKQRPIYPVSEVSETRARPAAASAARGANGARDRGYSSHEPGMVRLKLNLGREHGLNPNEIVGFIASRAEIPGSLIGKIRIQGDRSFVDVPEEVLAQVLTRTRDAKLRKQPMELQVA